MNALTFQNTQFDIVDLNGQKWLRSPQIAEALGYGQANRVTDLYNRNADEFTNSMTALVKLPDLPPQNAEAGTDLRHQIDDTGQRREVRIFSLRGAHLLGMLANTEPAKDFRRWVLDVLEQANQPTIETVTMRHHLLATNPKLAVLMYYHQNELNISHMASLLNLSVRTVEKNLDRLKTWGLLNSTSSETQLTLI